MNNWHKVLGSLVIMTLTLGCSERKLPILGERETVQRTVDGQQVTDTLYHTVPDFKFVNQNADTVTARDFAGKIYVTDFFFTSCPTICPIMKKKLLEVYKKYQGNPNFGILSHTIDPRHDSVAVLRKYTKDLGIKGTQWQFVTGDRQKIYDMGQKQYLVTAQEDATSPGGFNHSAACILVDKQKHLRGMYDGTSDKEVAQLILDIQILLDEKQ